MDFDFNIILVPITLMLGLIWLIDKLWLKRNRRKDVVRSSSTSRVKSDIKEHIDFKSKEDNFKHLLTKHGVAYDDALDSALDSIAIDSVSTDALTELKQAEQEYRDAKRQLNIKHKAASAQSKSEPFFIRWANDYFPVLAVVLIVRSFIIEPFNIPSPSMVPALYTGDFVAVNKYAYGLRLPLVYKKIIDIGNPKRGDVAVFRFPENPKIYYIKRVIGLPGDSVSFNQGQLFINGNSVPIKQVNFTDDPEMVNQMYTPNKEMLGNGTGASPEQAAIQKAKREESGAKYYQETLGEHTYLRRYLARSEAKAKYSQFLNSNVTQQEGSWTVTVPHDNYFVMGDNADRSGDSRFWGFVPDENLAGKATYVWMHKKPGLWNMPTFAYNRAID